MRHARTSECSQIRAFSLGFYIFNWKNEIIFIVCSLTSTDPIDPNFSDILKTLTLICDAHPECSQFVYSWASNLLYNNMMSPISLNLFVLLLRTADNKNDSQISKLTNTILNSGFDYWTIYRFSRLALQYGHWTHIALPLLEKIHAKVGRIN